MKKKEIQELRNKPLDELQALLQTSRDELQVLRFDLMKGKVKNLARERGLKRDIARILTFITIHEHETSA